jgi:hypothetical protein
MRRGIFQENPSEKLARDNSKYTGIDPVVGGPTLVRVWFSNGWSVVGSSTGGSETGVAGEGRNR